MDLRTRDGATGQPKNVKLMAIRPDGTRLMGGWFRDPPPYEGWIFDTWIEPAKDEVK